MVSATVSQSPQIQPQIQVGKELTALSASEVELSIVMPCLNEAETLERCIRKAVNFLETHHIAGEVVIGDNGSTDGSQNIARQCGARVVDVKQRGYGAAVMGASQAARGKYIIMGDADDSYDFSDLQAFVDQLRAGHDVVMGNRFAGGIKPGAMPWKNRYIGNPVLTGIGRLLFRCPVGDFHCGLRGYSAAALRRMDLRTTGMEFASEMVIKATLLGLKMTEVGTTLSPDGRSRPPHLRPWRDGWRHLRFMLLYSPRWLFLMPGIALMLIGALATAWLLPGPREVGGVRFDVHTLLYAALAVLIGFQAVCFAAFTRVFAMEEGLIPGDAWLQRVLKYVSLEMGLVFGAVLMLGGFGGSLLAVYRWHQESFGPLNVAVMARTVIPAAVALALGCQIILASLFLSMLGLRMRRPSANGNGHGNGHQH